MSREYANDPDRYRDFPLPGDDAEPYEEDVPAHAFYVLGRATPTVAFRAYDARPTLETALEAECEVAARLTTRGWVSPETTIVARSSLSVGTAERYEAQIADKTLLHQPPVPLHRALPPASAIAEALRREREEPAP
jgi:hypothetical protein